MGARLLVSKELLAEVPAVMEAARVRLWVAVYKVEPRTKRTIQKSGILLDKLAAKRREGLDVRCILNFSHKGRGLLGMNMAVSRWLGERGIEVRRLPFGQTCHAKVIIVDDVAAIVGSHNWATTSLVSNFEVSVVVYDREMVCRLVDVYGLMWDRSTRIEV